MPAGSVPFAKNPLKLPETSKDSVACCTPIMQTQPTLQLENVIDDRLEMQRLHPQLFDDYLATGWRLLGNSLVRHNFSVSGGRCAGRPLRIRLDDFTCSKSQRQLLRRNAGLDVWRGPST